MSSDIFGNEFINNTESLYYRVSDNSKYMLSAVNFSVLTFSLENYFL